MRTRSTWLFLAISALTASLAGQGCSDDDDQRAPPSGLTGGLTTSSQTGSGGASSATSGAGGDATATTGSGPGHAYCAKSCEADLDCCPAGALDCPGDYPNNYSCAGGICVPAHCETDAHCTIGTCHAVGGLGSCFNPCTTDDECSFAPNGTCSGVADDGAKYCTVPTAPCADDGDCFGTGRCKDGVCTCESDLDCGGTTDTCVME